MNKKVVIGSRESKLAVLQSQMVKDYIVCRHPQMDVEILTGAAGRKKQNRINLSNT